VVVRKSSRRERKTRVQVLEGYSCRWGLTDSATSFVACFSFVLLLHVGPTAIPIVLPFNIYTAALSCESDPPVDDRSLLRCILVHLTIDENQFGPAPKIANVSCNCCRRFLSLRQVVHSSIPIICSPVQALDGRKECSEPCKNPGTPLCRRRHPRNYEREK